MLDQNFMNNLTPVEVEFISACISKVYKQKVTSETQNFENLEGAVCECPNCHSKHFIKYGHIRSNGNQRYLCKNCGASFSASTNTFFSHCRSSYETWAEFIACELNDDTLRQEALHTQCSVSTCFNMRHMLHDAASRRTSDQLHGLVEIDATYSPINLKGTKEKNMPRISKPRGKHKSSSLNKELRGISRHKVCIISAIDESDNMFFKIAGLGPESLEMYEKFADHFGKDITLVSDDKPAILNFADNHKFVKDTIPVIATKDTYTTPNGNSLAEINELHREYKDFVRKKHGISIRHTQGYLDWLVFKKQISYSYELRKQKSMSYMKIMTERSKLRCDDICKQELPIDLRTAYEEYHYGIFAETNSDTGTNT